MRRVSASSTFAGKVVRPSRMIAGSGTPTQATPPGRDGWKQPCLRPRLETPPCRSSGGGWKTRFISPWQDGILLPFQPGVQQDDAPRLRQGLGERARGQESGPAGGAAGPRRLLPGQYPSRGSQRGQERPRRPPGRDRRRRGPRGVSLGGGRACPATERQREYIRAERSKGVSQRELAKRLEVSRCHPTGGQVAIRGVNAVSDASAAALDTGTPRSARGTSCGRWRWGRVRAGGPGPAGP